MDDMSTAACASLSCLNLTPPSRGESPSSAPPPPPSCTATAQGVDVIVDVEAGEDETQRRGLFHAAIDGDLELLSRMAAKLEAAARNGTGPRAGGVWSTCGHNALHLAAANGRMHVCRFLVQDLGFPVDARARSSSGDTPLILAALSGHTATAAYLLERGADPRARDSDGDTPLHWAAYNGDRELAMLLLHRGADVGATNPRGTALHVAASRAHPEVVAVLLRHGAEPNKIANCVYTPLVSALVGGSLECMKLLILAGANVNTGGFAGATPLFFACSSRGHVPFVKCLLNAGANPNGLDELGRLPIEVAAVHAERELVEVLFPVTQRPSTMLDWSWSVAGVVRRVNSAAYQERVIKASLIRKDELKQQGHSALRRKDYDAAILLYSMAMKFGYTDATLYSDRSLCWLRHGVGEEALSDAQACIKMRPNWAKGYYRQGMAFRLLEDHASSAESLLKASKLDRENAEIKEALRIVSVSRDVSRKSRKARNRRSGRN